MNIDSLNYFLQVAISKNISTVAKNSHISQSALSQQILKLENELNVKLLNRSNKGVSLTSEGDILFKYSKSILSSYNTMQQELLALLNEKRYISIQAIESISITVLPNIISDFKKIRSSYTVNINTLDCCSNIDLTNNICDIYICHKKLDHIEKIITSKIGVDEIILVSNTGFPINFVKKSELLDLPLIFPSAKECLKESLCSILDCDGYNLNNLNILYTTNSYFAALNGTLSTKALTFIPMSLYNNYHGKGNIKKIEIEDFSISIPLYINYFESFYKANSDYIKQLKNMLKGYFE